MTTTDDELAIRRVAETDVQSLIDLRLEALRSDPVGFSADYETDKERPTASTNTAAIRCYARCGFSVYGLQPMAICVENTYYDELLMAQKL